MMVPLILAVTAPVSYVVPPPPLRLAGAAVTLVVTRLSAIGPFWSAPVALVVSTTEAALVLPPELTTAVTGEAVVLSAAAKAFATVTALFAVATKDTW